MHMVLKDTAQNTKGYITVVVRDIELIKRRLNAIEEALEGTKFRRAPELPVLSTCCTAADPGHANSAPAGI